MFKFKGISSKDMQVIIEEEEHFIARAARRYETIEIEGRDGAIFNELGYSYVERPIYVQCLNPDKIDEILSWLDGEGAFEYKGRKTTARFYSELEPKREGYIRIIDTTFIRDPFWTKLDDEFVEIKGNKEKTQEAENINLKGTIPTKFKEFKLSGNSKQETSDTMPSPEFPSPIQNVEGDVNVTVANKEKTEQQTVTFPLAQRQKLMLGDYLAADGIHHVRKQIELDGTDFSLYSNQVAGRTIYMISAFSNNNNFKTYDSSILCNILKQGTSSNGNNYLNNNGSSGSLYVSIENSILGITDKSTNEEKLQAFQNLIAETGFVYEGELAEEETEAYTEEQQEAYNQLINLKAYEEETNVYSTNSTSPIFKVTAVQSTNAMLTQMKQLILEGGN